MSTAPNRKMTSAEYLEADRNSDKRNIFFGGEMFAMTGARRPHILIVGNIHAELHSQLKDRSCEVYMADMRVKNNRTGSYFYPDISVTCESPKFEDGVFDTLVNPQVIIEVLSESTETFDRGQKFDDYQLLESVKDYVLISQQRMQVERFTRQTESTWEYWSAKQPDDVLNLAAIDCQIELADIYNRIDFNSDDLKVIEGKSPFLAGVSR